MKGYLHEAIEKCVYVYPQGTLYHRRRNGKGLSNPENVDISYDDATMTVSVRTNATGTFSHEGEQLDVLVESGTGYDFGGLANNAHYPRPFYEYADDLLKERIPSLEDGYAEYVEDNL